MASDMKAVDPDRAPLSFVIDGSVHPQIARYLCDQTRFRVLSILGKSIYGHVFLAMDQCTPTSLHPIALKVSIVKKIQQAHVENNINLERDVLENPIFEANLMKRLGLASTADRHDSLLGLVDSFLSSNAELHCIVMEYAPRGDLFNIMMRKSNPLHFTETEALQMFRPIALGVRFMHQKGVCHLDLSLENILLDDQLHPKISDLGIARLLPADPDANHFTSIFVRSKPSYMAPEVIQQLPFDGRKADVFSLGVILYGMLLHTFPFKRALPTDVSYTLISTGRLREYLRRSNCSIPIGDSAVDLLSRMICPESRRLSLDQVLMHAFVRAAPLAPSPSLPVLCESRCNVI